MEFKLRPVLLLRHAACLVVDDVQSAIGISIYPVYPATQNEACGNIYLHKFFHHQRLHTDIVIGNKLSELGRCLLCPPNFILMIAEADAVPLPVAPQELLDSIGCP